MTCGTDSGTLRGQDYAPITTVGALSWTGAHMPLADHTPGRESIHGKPCSIATLLATLPAEDHDELTAWLENRAYSNGAIWNSLRDAGYQVGRQTVGRHRRGECRCGK